MLRMLSRCLSGALAVLSLIALSVLTTPSAAAEASRPKPQFLTGPATGDALDLAVDFLRSRTQKGAAEVDFNSLALRDRYTTTHNGTTHIYMTQRVHGLEIANQVININVSARGEIINQGGRLLTSLEQRAAAPQPSRTSREAVLDAARHLGLTGDGPLYETQRARQSSAAEVYRAEKLSLEDIPVTLKYYALDSSELRLAWDLVIATHDEKHIYNVFIDAHSGELLARHDWVHSDSYEVYAMPQESPADGPRTFEIQPADALASPFGWHDKDGADGAEFTDTRGNNVHAQEDADANNSGGYRPDGGAALDFSFPIDLGEDPTTYQEAVITHLFYWNNVLHDILWHYGFDEPAGNFQSNNYGRGGNGGDPVLADAQDGSGTNNANFATPPEGGSINPAPRMQMYLWIPSADHLVTVSSPAGRDGEDRIGAGLIGDYHAGGADFGPVLDSDGVTGVLELAEDRSAPTRDGCEAFVGFTAGRIALIDRGTCAFTQKVENAQNAGAIAAIIVNDRGDGVLTMGGADGTLSIPAVFVGESDGDALKSEQGVDLISTVKAAGKAIPIRDSSLDNSIIAHEYGHGLSIRLTGGPTNSNCLSGDQQAGEGWSDFLALALTAQRGDQATDTRGVGAYASFQPATGRGTRPHPYTTELEANPHTYEDIAAVSIPHGVGSVWSAMVWEMYWRLVDKYGFDPNLYTGTGGNNLALQLVIDGLKLQPCNPTFVDARNAILLADQNNNDGANQCEIWQSFAKRGLGIDANDGGSSKSLEVTEDFSVPSECAETCGNDIIEATEVCDGSDLGGETCSGRGCSSRGSLACNASCDGYDTSACLDCPAGDNDGICELG